MDIGPHNHRNHPMLDLFVEKERIALTYAALNKLDSMTADIQNVHLQTPSSEKHYITCGLKFGLENVGKRVLIKRTLYGGKASVSNFW